MILFDWRLEELGESFIRGRFDLDAFIFFYNLNENT